MKLGHVLWRKYFLCLLASGCSWHIALLVTEETANKLITSSFSMTPLDQGQRSVGEPRWLMEFLGRQTLAVLLQNVAAVSRVSCPYWFILWLPCSKPPQYGFFFSRQASIFHLGFFHTCRTTTFLVISLRLWVVSSFTESFYITLV